MFTVQPILFHQRRGLELLKNMGVLVFTRRTGLGEKWNLVRLCGFPVGFALRAVARNALSVCGRLLDQGEVFRLRHPDFRLRWARWCVLGLHRAQT